MLAESGGEGGPAVLVEIDDGVEDEKEMFMGDGGLENVWQFGKKDVVEHAGVGYFVSQIKVGVAAGGHFQAELVDSHSEVPHLGFGLPFSWAHHRVFVSFLIAFLPECDHSINRLEDGSWVSAFLCVILVLFN